MQRVEDFSELIRLKQSRQKNTQSKASHEKKQSSDAFTRPVYLQTNPRHRPEENDKEEEPDRKPYAPDFPVHRGAGRSAVKSG